MAAPCRFVSTRWSRISGDVKQWTRVTRVAGQEIRLVRTFSYRNVEKRRLFEAAECNGAGGASDLRPFAMRCDARAHLGAGRSSGSQGGP